MAGIRMSGLASGLDTENLVKDLMKAQTAKRDVLYKEKTKMQWKKDVWKEMNTKLYSFYTDAVFKLKNASTFGLKKATSSNGDALDVTANSDATVGVQKFSIEELAAGSVLTSDTVGTATNSTLLKDLVPFTGSKTITVSTDGGTTSHDLVLTDTDKVSDVVTKLKALDSNLKVSFDGNYHRFFLSTKNVGAGNEIRMTTSDGADLLAGLGFGPGKQNGTVGTDAEFTYNGTQFTSKSNEVTINNLKVTLKAKTTADVDITVNNDVESIYNNVKSFVDAYNGMLENIDLKLDAASTKGYEPLTDEEKSALDATTITKWEDTVKSSLLRRDQTLNTIRNSIRSIVTASNGINTTNLSPGVNYLSDIGIETGAYTEKGKLHINGDDTNPTYALKTNKLKEAIENDPDGVVNLLVGIGEKLSSELQDKMKATTLSSALTFFNDKQMTNKVYEYEDRITKLEEAMAVSEERYYAQFTALEKVMSETQSQSTWLSGQFGG